MESGHGHVHSQPFAFVDRLITSPANVIDYLVLQFLRNLETTWNPTGVTEGEIALQPVFQKRHANLQLRQLPVSKAQSTIQS